MLNWMGRVLEVPEELRRNWELALDCVVNFILVILVTIASASFLMAQKKSLLMTRATILCLPKSANSFNS